MMKASSILGWKYLVSKIHPQLPLSPRESEKLLSLLQNSFRQQLNQEHAESGNATDNHLQSILQSPLFEVEPKRRGFDSVDRRSSSQLGRIQIIRDQPMEYFNERIVTGTATLDLARICLAAQYKKLCLPSSDCPKAPKASNKAFDTGSIILSWLRSSGIAESKSFLRDQRFVVLLVPFLVVEGHGDLVWRWVKQLQSEPDQMSPESTFAKSRHLFDKMIRSEAKFGAGVASSLDLFMRKVCEERSSKKQSGYIARGFFDPAGAYLCAALTKASAGNVTEIERIDEFYRTVVTWSSRPLYHRGLLELSHPQSSAATSALRYLKEWTPQKQYRKRTIHLGFKAAEVLLSQDSQADALWVMGFLKANFGEELGLSPTSEALGINPLKQEMAIGQEEEMSLRSLEALEAH